MSLRTIWICRRYSSSIDVLTMTMLESRITDQANDGQMTKWAMSDPPSFGFHHSFVIRPFVIRHYLWREPIDLPRSVRLPRVAKAIVQTIGTALPKFHFIRLESITAPVRRQWNWLVAKALGHLRHARIEHTPAIEHLALTRRPCAQLASDRARMKIDLRFVTRGLFHFSTDTNLPVEFDPVKHKRGVRIGLELFPLCAFVIRKEHEAILIEAFQQNDSH